MVPAYPVTEEMLRPLLVPMDGREKTAMRSRHPKYTPDLVLSVDKLLFQIEHGENRVIGFAKELREGLSFFLEECGRHASADVCTAVRQTDH